MTAKTEDPAFDAFFAPIKAALARFDNGPACGLCDATILRPSDFPNLSPPSPSQAAKACDESVRSARCPRIGQFVIAQHGVNCRFFRMDRAKYQEQHGHE